MRNPDEIELFDLTKQFEYRIMTDEINNCRDIDELRLVSKCYLKLYLSTLESISRLQSI